MADAITALELAVRLENDETAPFILDVRAPDDVERWKVEGRIEPAAHNVPYWTALADIDATRQAIPDDKDVVVVCAYGGSSEMVVDMMGASNAVNLGGGMEAWAQTLVAHELFAENDQFVVQFDRIAKACLSYAVGSRGRTMCVIDPAVDPQPYIDFAKSVGCTITDVFDTHLHADHVSVAVRLANVVGATYHIAAGDADGAQFEYAALVDGETFRFGDVELVVRSVATPGHTPGSTSLEVAGRFLMTGDAVFVSGVGRPDLGGKPEPWARDLFATIRRRLMSLDPELDVCPAHYTSRGEARPDGTLRRTLGDLLTNDPVVSIEDEEQFVEYVVSHLGDAPPVYDEIRRVNLGLLERNLEELQVLEVGRNECALRS